MEREMFFRDRVEKVKNSGLEPLMEQTITELAGDRRVLIEQHRGVRAYSREQILVNVKFGILCVCGKNLEILRMTGHQLVICGCIDSICIQRGQQG